MPATNKLVSIIKPSTPCTGLAVTVPAATASATASSSITMSTSLLAAWKMIVDVSCVV
jgi:hypothetical protein